MACFLGPVHETYLIRLLNVSRFRVQQLEVINNLKQHIFATPGPNIINLTLRQAVLRGDFNVKSAGYGKIGTINYNMKQRNFLLSNKLVKNPYVEKTFHDHNESIEKFAQSFQ